MKRREKKQQKKYKFGLVGGVDALDICLTSWAWYLFPIYDIAVFYNTVAF